MQESMAAHAKPRANTLFRIGFGLMLLSFLFSATATYLYYSYDSYPNKIIQSTQTSKKNTEDGQKEYIIQPTRDWHILVAGITFGFLCLAVARSILLQQSSEMKSYFEIGQKARYFERINSTVQLILQQDESTTNSEKEAINFLKENFLTEPLTREETNKSEDISLESKAAELLKVAPIPKLPTE